MVNVTLGYINMGFNIIIGIVLVPAYIHYVGIRMYGLWLATGGMVVWLGMLDMGISNQMGQRVASAYGARNRLKFGSYYANGILIQLVLVAGLTVFAIGLSMAIPKMLKVSGAEAQTLTHCALLAGLSLGLQQLATGQANILNALQRPIVKFLGQFSGGIVTIVTIVTLLSAGRGLHAIPEGMLAGAGLNLGIVGSYAFWLVWESAAPLKLQWPVVQEMIGIATTSFLAVASGAIVGRIEPTIIAMTISPEMSVIYSNTKRAADITGTLTAMLIGSVNSGLSHLQAQGVETKVRSVFSDVLLLTFHTSMVMVAVYVAMNHSFVALWVGEKCFAGTGVMLLIALSVVITGFASVFTNALGAFGDFKFNNLLTFTESIVRLGLMGTLVFSLRLDGLPLATSLTGLIMLATAAWRIRRKMGIILDWRGEGVRTVLGSMGILTTAILLAVSFHATSWPQLAAWGAASAFVFIAWDFGSSGRLRSLASEMLGPRLTSWFRRTA